MAAIMHHEYVIEHINGARRSIRRNSTIPNLVKAALALHNHPELRSVDVYRVLSDGSRNRVAFFHDGNVTRAKPVAPRPVAAQAAQATATPAAAHFWNVSTKRVGGLRFVRIGRLSMSFCMTRKPVSK